MLLNKIPYKDLLIVFFKLLLLIIGLNIFLTSVYSIIKKEFSVDKLKSEIYIDVKKP